MSGRYAGVRLRKVGVCPSCGSKPRRVYTHGRAGTVIEWGCSPRRCRLELNRTLAAGPRPSSFEPLPVDDRRSSRSRYPGSAA